MLIFETSQIDDMTAKLATTDPGIMHFQRLIDRCIHRNNLERTAKDAYFFIHDLKDRLSNRVQLTSDGLNCYLEAVESAFGSAIDYAQLVKLYGGDTPERGSAPAEIRYSPPPCTGARKTRISGRPDKNLVSTSFVERQNLTLRMSNRRFTRLTNGYSKKLENHAHMLAIHFMVYNFCRIHHTLRVTPAMEAGVSDHLWELEELLVAPEKEAVAA